MPGSEKADDTKKADVSNGDATHNPAVPVEYDQFGLKVKRHADPMPVSWDTEEDSSSKKEVAEQETRTDNGAKNGPASIKGRLDNLKVPAQVDDGGSSDEEEEFKDAQSTNGATTPIPKQETKEDVPQSETDAEIALFETRVTVQEAVSSPHEDKPSPMEPVTDSPKEPADEAAPSASENAISIEPSNHNGQHQGQGLGSGGISEWSHQKGAEPKDEVKDAEEDEWQTMPAFAPYDIYDDDNRLIAREAHDSDVEADAYEGLGGAGKGYTRVQLDDDAQSATSLDDNTQYLFKQANGTGAGEMEDEEQRDALSQMQATKDLLTEGQRIAYVGVTRLVLTSMFQQAEALIAAKGSKKGEVSVAAEALQMWSQKMMVRLYAHMEISADEQIMIEQLADHGVIPTDMTPTLMQNARVKNPMAEKAGSTTSAFSPRPDSVASFEGKHRLSVSSASMNSPRLPLSPRLYDEAPAHVPPPYQENTGEDMPEVRTPSQLPTTAKLDIDLRWTVLCDLFLTLIADSVYDARSRTLLEKVGENLDITWLDICRFEKRVTDTLEMQQAAEKENWNEDEHKENRRKLALTKRYVMMGLATVGGGLVIGLSAGLLAPVIGAGLAAGFTTIGVAGTSGFLAGAGGAAIITSGAAASGGIIAVRAAGRRTGAVKTFEYRPLHNNKRVNLIVTVSGWMTGKVDDVRLPYSTVDPIMGDIYSVLWEPEMLRSMGDTINILATEALTQGLQQVLGSTILIGLMAALQLPVVLTKLAYLIDNPWTVSLDRANAAGLILADSLIDRNLGTRPITFVGYSLGSRVIFSCLKELSKKGAYGLVQNVYLFGSPIVAKKDEYLKARSVVAGRFVNGYARNDWILGYLFRLTSGGISRVAGLAPIEGVPGVENVDVTELVPGHMSYRTAMPRLLREVGWLVESDEFTEIEDPDPENHQQRQRELINEIEEARKEFEKKEKEAAKGSGKFGFFSRKKKTVLEKKEWEMYEESKGELAGRREMEDERGNNHGVLFDVDAIRAELASEQIEVRELKSTLPPMKLDLASPSSSDPRNPRSPLRETRSYDASTMLKPTGFQTPMHSPRQATSSSEYIPQMRSPPVYAEEEEEEEVQMSFDTAYRSPPRSATTSFMNFPTRDTMPVVETRERAQTFGLGLEQRPELKSAQTEGGGKALPQLPRMEFDHNAWADEDEEFEGHEKEIEMTFA